MLKLQFLLQRVNLPEKASKGSEKFHPAQLSSDLPQAAVTLLSSLLAPPQSRLALVALSFHCQSEHIYGAESPLEAQESGAPAL